MGVDVIISFDYLHSPIRLRLLALLERRLPRDFEAPLFAVCAALAIVTGAGLIQSHHLREARQMERSYEARFLVTQRAVKKSRVYYDEVKDLCALDDKVQRIARSGLADALRTADIANRLPPHAWLTSISRDADGLLLEGRARDFEVVSRMVRGLSGSARLRNLQLVDASELADRTGAPLIKYQVHLEEVMP